MVCGGVNGKNEGAEDKVIKQDLQLFGGVPLAVFVNPVFQYEGELVLGTAHVVSAKLFGVSVQRLTQLPPQQTRADCTRIQAWKGWIKVSHKLVCSICSDELIEI